MVASIVMGALAGRHDSHATVVGLSRCTSLLQSVLSVPSSFFLFFFLFRQRLKANMSLESRVCCVYDECGSKSVK